MTFRSLFAESVEGGHAGVRPSGADHGAELIAADVLGDQFRARQVRTRFSAGGVFAVTESALSAEAHLTLADLRGSIGLRCRRFRAGLRCRALRGRTRGAALRIRLAKSRRGLKEQDAGDPHGREGGYVLHGPN